MEDVLQIEICPSEPRASFCDWLGDAREDILDCTAPGDAEPACTYVLQAYDVEFRIIVRNAAGKYENRVATDEEISATARALHSDSETDFDDVDKAKLYLVWDAAHDAVDEWENGSD